MSRSEIDRLDELEARYTLLEQSYQELNEVVTRQWRLIEIQSLKLERLEAAVDNPDFVSSVAEPPPPHY